MIRCRDVVLATLGVAVLVGCGSDERDGGPPDTETPVADVIELDADEVRLADIAFTTVAALQPDTVHLTGIFTFAPALVSHIGPRVEGRLKSVAVEIGSDVRAGEALAVLDSPELGAAQAGWFKALVNRDVGRKNYERVERLSRQGIVSERRRLEVEGEVRQREAELAAAASSLHALGVEPDSAASSMFALRSPLDGIVVDKHATVGEVVDTDAVLFTVGDPRTLWIELDVYEADLARVGIGAPALVTTNAYPDRTFTGQTTYIAAVLDADSRTVKVRVEIPNSDLTLKPGMFARAALVLSEPDPPIGLPADAIQILDGQPVVFIPEGGGRFRIRQVTVGRTRAGGWTEIRSGLGVGDSVVERGSFALKAQLLKESFAEEE